MGVRRLEERHSARKASAGTMRTPPRCSGLLVLLWPLEWRSAWRWPTRQ